MQLQQREAEISKLHSVISDTHSAGAGSTARLRSEFEARVEQLRRQWVSQMDKLRADREEADVSAAQLRAQNEALRVEAEQLRAENVRLQEARLALRRMLDGVS